MKRSTIFRILNISILVIIIFCNSISYGFSVDDLKGQQTASQKPIEDAGQSVIKILSTVGSIISVVVLVILGIKYMLGSVEEKAEYKKTMMAYVIGAVFVFAASTIASVIYNIAK